MEQNRKTNDQVVFTASRPLLVRGDHSGGAFLAFDVVVNYGVGYDVHEGGWRLQGGEVRRYEVVRQAGRRRTAREQRAFVPLPVAKAVLQSMVAQGWRVCFPEVTWPGGAVTPISSSGPHDQALQ